MEPWNLAAHHLYLRQGESRVRAPLLQAGRQTILRAGAQGMREHEHSRLQATPHARRACNRTDRRARHLPQTDRSGRRRAGENRTAASGRRLRRLRTTANRRPRVAADTALNLPAVRRAATTGTVRHRVQAATRVNPVPVTVPVTMGAAVVRVRN